MNGRSPSALDLMRYADGELPAEQAEQIEAYLSESQEGRAIVATYFEIGARVRQHADETARDGSADCIADESWLGWTRRRRFAPWAR